MRRRLTVALVGIALISIVFVGLGVLLLAQVGARDAAVNKMSESLTALSDINFSEGRGPTDLGRLRTALELDQLEFVGVTRDGDLVAPRNRRNSDEQDSKLVERIKLSGDDYNKLREGDQVFVNLNRTVVGFQPLDADLPRGDLVPALIAQDGVATVGSGAQGWFLISATGVLLIAALLGSWLAQRFTKPIATIEAATRSIAAGDLNTRVAVTGTDELAQLGESVNTMAADLGRSRELEQQFLMSVSHDLRTPLTAIEGYAEALSDGAVEDPAHTGEVISNHASRLDRLVGDLLDLARLQAKKFQMETRVIDPAVTVGRTVAGLAPEARSRGIDLQNNLTTGLSVSADPDRVGQIVANLVENALKYADSKILVTVAPFLTEEGVSVARVVVADDGPGISPEDLPRVFERLYVTQQKPKREESSSGLGLAIVRELTHAMGGHVSVSSEVGSGTLMVVELPTV